MEPQPEDFYLRFLPGTLRRKIAAHPGLRAILGNISWLLFDRILRLGVGLLVTIWIARHLGPEQFGLLNYAMAFVALFSVIAVFGMNDIVVRDLVSTPGQADVTLGTALLLQFIGGAIAFNCAVFAISLARPDDFQAQFIVMLLSLAAVFKASEVFKYWFESRVESKYPVLAENSVFLIFSAIKIVLIVYQAPLIAFVGAMAAEQIFLAVGFIAAYQLKHNQLSLLRSDFSRAIRLLRDGFPLFLSGLAVIIYMRIDQIMIGQILGDEAVGVYSAAVRVSEVWYFIPMILVSSTFPHLIAERKNDKAAYLKKLQKLFRLLTLISIVAGGFATFFSDTLINVLYGERYQQAGAVLMIHIWSGVFVSLGLASGKWYLLEGRSSGLFYRTLLGAIANVALNFLLIPGYGIIGAAIATLISHAIADFFYDLIGIESRAIFTMKLGALRPW